MIDRLCSSAIKSSAMIDPDRQIGLKFLALLISTFTSCFCWRPVSLVCNCFHDLALPRHYAARVLVVCSNIMRHIQMWRSNGSSWIILWPGNVTAWPIFFMRWHAHSLTHTTWSSILHFENATSLTVCMLGEYGGTISLLLIYQHAVSTLDDCICWSDSSL